MLLNDVFNYQLLVKHLGQLIEISGHKNDELAQKIDVKPANFNAKIKKGNWTADEALRVLTIIENEKTDDYWFRLKGISPHEFKKK